MRTPLSLMSYARAIWVPVLMLTNIHSKMSILVHCICTYLHHRNDWADLLRNVKEICRFLSCWHNYRYQYDSESMLQMWSREQTSNRLENALSTATQMRSQLGLLMPNWLQYICVQKQFEGISEVQRRWGILDSSLYNCISGTSVAYRNKNEYEMRWECIPDEIILILVCKWLWFIFPLMQTSRTEAVANNIERLSQYEKQVM